MAESQAPYRFEEADEFCTIVLLPELNKAPWGDIDSIGTSVLERMNARMSAGRNKPGFIVDLTALNYMGSAMVALVVRLWKAAKEKNARLVVVNSDAMVLEVLDLAGLTQVWTIVDNRADALNSLGVTEKKPEASSVPGAAGTATGYAAGSAASPRVALWLVLTLLCLAASGAGLYLFSADPMPVEDVRIPLGLLFGGGVLGLITATATTSLGTGLPRTFGAACVIGMLALLVSGVYVHPHRAAIFKGRDADEKRAKNPDGGNPQNPSGKTTPNSKSGKSIPVVAPRPNKTATPPAPGGPAIPPN